MVPPAGGVPTGNQFLTNALLGGPSCGSDDVASVVEDNAGVLLCSVMGPEVFKLQNFGVVLPYGGSGQSQRSSKCMSICMCTSVIGHSEFWEYIGGDDVAREL